ncbi:Two component signal transduction histidine kinase [Modestobacter italicus]|uniref:Two component signal transduction histidine kinase n=1 Tax=Modestobacter italicus (strain DSM 44449 / CECT 9708 / BC 501) TaxID=2732864 RepID=I4EUY2_MODI5|nr:histidine kinase [Modestobacter marinus]CCH87195.1 Two component signal transduction histidine kinase [Modestobacter marinus]
MDRSSWWGQAIWALPWLLFQYFPISDLVTTDRPAAARWVGAVGLLAFTLVYLRAIGQLGRPRALRADFVVMVGLAAALAVGFGADWSGLMIYVSAAAAAALPWRWVWPAVVAAALLCLVVILADEDSGLLFLPPICLLTAFGISGTGYLMTVNRELQEAREELARSAVAEERMRFARDLHDLLGHSLSLIALKSELARRLAEVDPPRARQEMADVEEAARRALAEVRDAVSGYRQVSCAQALAEARAALTGAGVAVRLPDVVPVLPGGVDAALGWVVREATTNVLRHSGAARVTVELTEDGVRAVLTVTDDGAGTGERLTVLGGSGAGLAGLRERVAALGGELAAGPVDGGGYRVRAEVPLLPAAVTA